jgi:cell division septation protein DedD
MPEGAVVLQVAALTQESNALTMAEALQKKNFPAFVLGPSTALYFQVGVGQYAHTESARIAKRMLEKMRFKAIVKR